LVATLKVGDELNKHASNISICRNIAGVHYRSDYTESVKLGEAEAISVGGDLHHHEDSKRRRII
jgi:hypothetical protein